MNKPIIEKIRKLLELADRQKNNSESEIENALNSAHRLMKAHGITADDLHDKLEIGDFELADLPQLDTFIRYITQAISDLFDCEYLTVRGRRVNIRIIGDATDAAIAREAWLILTKNVKSRARSLYGSTWSAKHRSFCEAYGLALCVKVTEMKKLDQNSTEDNKYAVILSRKNTAIDDFIAVQFPNARLRGARKMNDQDETAFSHGYDEGMKQKLNFRSAINGSGETKLLSG